MKLETPIHPKTLAFIGGGINSAVGYTHYVASQLDERWQVIGGVFSRQAAINQATAQRWHIPHTNLFNNWQQMLQAEHFRPQAVSLLTPTPSHAPILAALIEQNIPVICEKAMVADLSQAAQVQAALAKNPQAFLVVTFNYSGYPLLRELRRLVQGGDLGHIHKIRVQMPSDAFMRPGVKPQSWRRQDGAIPTLLLDLGVHLHHLVGFVTGKKPLAVLADFHHYGQVQHIVDDAHLWIRYEGELFVDFSVSKTTLGVRNGMAIEVFGQQGSAQWVQEKPEELHIFDQNSVHHIYDRGNAPYEGEIIERFKPGHPAGFIEAFGNLYGDIADAYEAWQAGKPYLNDYVYGFDHAYEGLRLLTAAVEANKQGQWVLLEAIDA